MKPKKILSMLMAVLMVVTMLPSLVFAAAAPAGELGGKLKFKGKAAVGTELSADYTKAAPEGLTDDYVTFQWSRKVGEELTEVGTEKTYTLTEEDLGNKIVLKITGIAEKGVSGELKATTVPIVATPEEAPEETTEEVKEEGAAAEGLDEIPTEPVEEGIEELPAEDAGQVPAEGTPAEEIPAEGTAEAPEEIPEAAGDGTGEQLPEEEEVIDEAEAPIQTDDSVIEIGNEETLSIPESAADAGVPEELTYTAEAATEDGTGVLNFGTMTAGAEETPEAQYVTVTNTGTGVLNFASIAPDHFMVDDIVDPLQPGASVTLAIQPRAGIEAGTYQDLITYTSEEGAAASVEADLTVEKAPAEEEQVVDTAQSETVEIPVQNEEGAAPEPPVVTNTFSLAEGTEVNAADTNNLTLDLGSVEKGSTVSKKITFDKTESVTVAVAPEQSNIVAVQDTTPGAEKRTKAEYTITSLNTLAEGSYTEKLTFTPTVTPTEGTDAAAADSTLTPIAITVTVNVTPAPEAKVTPDVTGAIAFAPAVEGYAVPEAKTVTLKNEGNADAKGLSVVLDEAAGKAFTAVLTAADIPANGGSTVLTIQPIAGLPAGDYSGSISIAGIQLEAFPVSFKVEAKTYTLTAAPAALDFGTLETGYTPAAQDVVLTNAGNTDIPVTVAANDYFDILNADGTAAADGTVPVGGTLTLKVQPKAGLAAGTYTDKPVVVKQTGTETVLASITAAFTVKAKDVYALSATPDAMDFGVAEAGYKEAPAAQTVTVKNDGNTAVTLTQPVGKHFETGALSAVTLEPGAAAAFTIRPKAGLGESIYEEDILVASDKSQTAVKAIFTVSEAAVKLTNVVKGKNISGLANKTEKSEKGLKLPSTVVIDTTNGKMKAKVKWDVKGCAYNQKSTEGQTFSVKGTVSLPKGVTNPDNISLITSVKVSVNGRAAIIADPANNIISGIDPTAAYTTETKITVTAIGAGMDNSAPGSGDTRYVPLSWKVLEARTWEGAPYSATFRMGKNGSYTMTVTFNQQKYDGTSWVNTGAQDTRQVNFNVAAVTGQNLTPAADRTDANRRNAVKTGDDTPILPFVIILAAAVICIAGIVIYRKKNHK